MEDEMDGVCCTHGEMRNAYKIVVGKLEGKQPYEKLRCRWEEWILTFIVHVLFIYDRSDRLPT
jgi:hypothetical protein